jgi:Tyrosine-protein kinase ephrin type A/B receptor-like
MSLSKSSSSNRLNFNVGSSRSRPGPGPLSSKRRHYENTKLRVIMSLFVLFASLTIFSSCCTSATQSVTMSYSSYYPDKRPGPGPGAGVGRRHLVHDGPFAFDGGLQDLVGTTFKFEPQPYNSASPYSDHRSASDSISESDHSDTDFGPALQALESFSASVAGSGSGTISELFTQQFGTSGRDVIYAIGIDESTGSQAGPGDLIIAGTTEGNIAAAPAGLNDIYVSRRSSRTGAVIWTTQLGSAGNDQVFDLAVAADGSIYCVGATTGPLFSARSAALTDLDVIVFKLTSGGAQDWTRQLDSTEGGRLDRGFNIQLSPDQTTLMVAGETEGTLLASNGALGGRDAFVLKLNTADGTTVFNRQYGTTEYDAATNMAMDADGSVFVIGQTDGEFEAGNLSGDTVTGRQDFFVLKVDKNGNSVFARQGGAASDSDIANAAAVHSASQSLFVAGETQGQLGAASTDPFKGVRDVFIARYSSVTGSIVWIRQIGTPAYDSVAGMTIDNIGRPILAGVTAGAFVSGYTPRARDSIAMKFDADGNELWRLQFGSVNDDESRGVAVSSGHVYLSGWGFGQISSTQPYVAMNDAVLVAVTDPTWSFPLCPKGKYCLANGTQVSCPGNTVNPALGQVTAAACIVCPAGYRCSNASSVTACTSGSYCPAGQSVELDCTQGYFCPNTTSQIACSSTQQSGAAAYCAARSTSSGLCPSGYFCPNAATRSVCDTTGTYCPAGSFAESQCPSGFYCPTSAQQFPCPGGSYCPSGSIADVPCECGYFCPNATARLTCPAGYACPERTVQSQQLRYQCASTTFCPAGSCTSQPCPAGSFCGTPQSKLVCTSGQHCPQGSTTPAICSAGSVCTSPSTSQVCALGSFCPAGTTVELSCPAGAFCASPRTKQNCTARQWCPAGSVLGNLCPAGWYCPSTIEHRVCNPGEYCPEGSLQTSSCPAGLYCETPSVAFTCPTGSKCPVGTITHTLCAEGLYSTAPGASECEPCPPGWTTQGAGSTSIKECRVEVPSQNSDLEFWETQDFLLGLLSSFGSLMVLVATQLVYRHVVKKSWKRSTRYVVSNYIRRSIGFSVGTVELAKTAGYTPCIDQLVGRVLDIEALPRELESAYCNRVGEHIMLMSTEDAQRIANALVFGIRHVLQFGGFRFFQGPKDYSFIERQRYFFDTIPNVLVAFCGCCCCCRKIPYAFDRDVMQFNMSAIVLAAKNELQGVVVIGADSATADYDDDGKQRSEDVESVEMTATSSSTTASHRMYTRADAGV